MRLSRSPIIRLVLRVLTLVVLLVVLVGAPAAVLVILGRPVPTAQQWSTMWRTHTLDPDAAVRLGAGLFLLLWMWFAATALQEWRRVWPARRAPLAPADRVRVSDGPSAWIRGAVRFIALSSVSAGALAGGLASVTHAAAAAPAAHVVVAGESYWAIADEYLDESLGRPATAHEVWELTQELVTANGPRLGHRDPTLLLPGETVVFPADVAEPAPTARPIPVSPSTTAASGAPDPAPATIAPATTVPSTIAPATIAPATTAPSTIAPATIAPDVGSPISASPSMAPPARATASATSSNIGARDVLAGAVLLGAGALTVAQARRRRALRAGALGMRLEEPSFRSARLELMLRALDPVERMARLDVAVRAAAKELAAQGSAVLAATMDDPGEICLWLASPADPEDGLWHPDILRDTWRLPASVPIEALAVLGREVAHPCPGLVQIGVTSGAAAGAALFVDLEAMGVLSVDSPAAPAIGRALALALAWSPWRGAGRIVAERCLAPVREDIECAADGSAVWAQLAAAQRGVSASLRGSTFAARVAATHGEQWEPVFGVVRGPRPSDVDTVAPWTGAGVLMLGPAATPFRVRLDGDHHVLEPFGIRFEPTTVDGETMDALEELVDTACATPVAVIPDAIPGTAAAPVGWREPRWDLLVTVLGQVSVQDRCGNIATFEKAKSLELLVWLTLHRERPTRSAARNALWDLAVRDSTFANVVSDARRSLARLVAPPHGEEWVGRTLTDDLPLHPRVVTDADLLAGRVAAARHLPPTEAVAVLRPGVELLHGLPFSGAGSGYLWVDGEGHTSAMVLLATGAAELLARHHLTLGDVDGVFWATGQGLKVLPGHEALIALRMQAHAAQGDLAGVRLEWEQYERALASDSWSDGEPSPKLAALRRDLLAPAGAARAM